MGEMKHDLDFLRLKSSGGGYSPRGPLEAQNVPLRVVLPSAYKLKPVTPKMKLSTTLAVLAAAAAEAHCTNSLSHHPPPPPFSLQPN